MKFRLILAMPAGLALCLMVACGGGSDGTLGNEHVSPAQPSTNSPVAYQCTEPSEGSMAIPQEAIMGGQIEGRTDGSFVVVSHRLWGVHHVVLMLGPDIARQGLLSGYIDAIPVRLSCPADGGLYSNGVQALNEDYNGSSIYLKMELDVARGLLSGTLRDYGTDGVAKSVSGGAIVGALFDPAQAPSIAEAVGDWTLTDAAGRPVELSIAPDGSLQLSSAACRYDGVLTPAERLNMLDMRLRPQSGCLLDTSETQGFVVLLPLAEGGQQLMLWGVDGGWGFVTQAIGRR